VDIRTDNVPSTVNVSVERSVEGRRNLCSVANIRGILPWKWALITCFANTAKKSVVACCKLVNIVTYVVVYKLGEN
jgi:hypothetical protein